MFCELLNLAVTIIKELRWSRPLQILTWCLTTAWEVMELDSSPENQSSTRIALLSDHPTMRKYSWQERLRSRREKRPKSKPKTWKSGTKTLPRAVHHYDVWETVTSHPLRKKRSYSALIQSNEDTSVQQCMWLAHVCSILVNKELRTLMSSLTKRRKCSSLS